MAAAIGGVPCLIKEILYAPVCPPSTTLLFEVALTHHNQCNYEAAINTYLEGLKEWEASLFKENFPEFDDDGQTSLLRTTSSGGVKNVSVMRRERLEGEEGELDGEPEEEEDANDEAAIEEAARREAEAEEERKEFLARKAHALHQCHELIPPEGRIFVRLATGSVFESAGDDARAMAEFLQAFKLLQKIPVFKTNLIAATVFSCLGCVYKNLSQYDFAADYYFRALEVREQLLGSDHVDVAPMLNNIAVVLHLMDKPSEALTLFHRAESILEARLHTTHVRVQTVKANIQKTKAVFLKNAVMEPVPFVSQPFQVIPGVKIAKKMLAPKAKKKAAAGDDKKKKK